MLGRIKSAKTKGEWDSFKKYLTDRERYVIELEAYKLLPFGKEILNTLEYILTIDATTVYDEDDNIIDFQAVIDEAKYKNNKTKRFTILKEIFEKKDQIEHLNFKCYVLETVWFTICSLLEFEPLPTRTIKERKMFDNFVQSMKVAISINQKISSIKNYAVFISNRFYHSHPHLKENSVFVNYITGLLINTVLIVKSEKDIRFEELKKIGLNFSNATQRKSIKDRLGDNYEKYRRIILFIHCITDKLPALSGAQKKACDLEGILPSTFAKWKNNNSEDYWRVYNSFSKEEIESGLKVIKETYLE